ncbi:Vacuolar amino acid transporter [Cladophialophora carrionii]|uniref:Vacuolar amino acid transporter n=1 Tax=Cladophialophora carrionii TaxID=86049 RepID=A0A1C1CUI8_9EURO|nr:Vacuolar amino acid transporter [Cladophialophora carrionii]
MPTDDEDSNGFIGKVPNGKIESYRHLLASADDTPSESRDRDSPTESVGHESRPPPLRQSSLSHPRPPGTPRTNNRVRFDLEHVASSPQPDEWVDEEDYLNSPSQRAPLLTDITPPSESPFLSESFQPEDYLPDARPKSGMSSAFMNMANSIIGAGIIGQPYAFRQAGMTMGIILLVALTATVDWTIRLIVINSKLSGADSFQATMQHCFGSSGLVAISIAQWAFAFGGMIAFCIIVGDTIPHVMEALIPGLRDVPFLWLLTDRRAIIVLFVLCISWPLSLYRDIAKLAKASTLALISMLIIIVTVVTQGASVDSELRGNLNGLLFVNDGFFQAVGVISFAFVCHHNSLLIYGSLKTPTIDRFATVTHYSTFISMIACLVMALAGFLTFGNKTKGNVLNNFPSQGHVMVQIARLCFGLNMLTTLPLECFVCREVMNNYWFPEEPYQPNRHLIFSSALVVTAMAISLITCDLGAVFELIGATSACALAYILPPLCYIKLSTRSWRTIPAVACIVFGFAVMAVSLILAMKKIIKNEGQHQQC